MCLKVVRINHQIIVETKHLNVRRPVFFFNTNMIHNHYIGLYRITDSPQNAFGENAAQWMCSTRILVEFCFF